MRLTADDMKKEQVDCPCALCLMLRSRRLEASRDAAGEACRATEPAPEPGKTRVRMLTADGWAR